MNNLHLQKYQFFRFTENGPNNDIYGSGVWDKEKIFLMLKIGDVYSQYLDLGLDDLETVTDLKIYDDSGNALVLGTHYFYTLKAIGNRIVLIFALKPSLNDFRTCETFYLSLITTKRTIFSNYFNLITEQSKLEETTLVTYWHSENFYNANYFDAEFIPQQIRLPLSFSHNFNDAEAEEYQDSYQLENRYRSGKIKRLFMESWKVILNDSNYSALCTALDSDNVYFDNVYFSLKPFTPERDKDEKGFSLSTIECQRDAKKTFDQDTFNEYFNIYSDDITYNFIYSHEPENEENSGQWFLVNRLYNNYVNDFGILYNCDLKTKITKVPIKGFLANNVTRYIYSVNDIISYCDKDNLVYFPNGFDNDLGVLGNYTEDFKFKIIDANGNSGKEMIHTINMVDSSVEPIDISCSIVFFDDSTAPKSGNDTQIVVKVANITFDPLDPVVSSVWEVFDGSNWIPLENQTSESFIFTLSRLENKIRLYIGTQYGDQVASNVLTYNRETSANIYITDRVTNIDMGTCFYKLHVEVTPFVGFANVVGTKGSRVKISRVNVGLFGDDLIIPSNTPIGVDVYNSTPVTIPVGVYNCSIRLTGAPVSISDDVILDGAISYGYDNDYYNGIAQAEAHLFIPAN